MSEKKLTKRDSLATRMAKRFGFDKSKATKKTAEKTAEKAEDAPPPEDENDDPTSVITGDLDATFKRAHLAIEGAQSSAERLCDVTQPMSAKDLRVLKRPALKRSSSEVS